MATENNSLTHLHEAIENYKGSVSSIINLLPENKQDLEDLLLGRGIDDTTTLHLIFEKGDANLIQQVFSKAYSKISTAQLAASLVLQDLSGATPIQTLLSREDAPAALEVLFRSCNDAHLDAIFLTQDRRGQTLLHTIGDFVTDDTMKANLLQVIYKALAGKRQLVGKFAGIKDIFDDTIGDLLSDPDINAKLEQAAKALPLKASGQEEVSQFAASALSSAQLKDIARVYSQARVPKLAPPGAMGFDFLKKHEALLHTANVVVSHYPTITKLVHLGNKHVLPEEHRLPESTMQKVDMFFKNAATFVGIGNGFTLKFATVEYHYLVQSMIFGSPYRVEFVNRGVNALLDKVESVDYPHAQHVAPTVNLLIDSAQIAYLLHSPQFQGLTGIAGKYKIIGAGALVGVPLLAGYVFDKLGYSLEGRLIVSGHDIGGYAQSALVHVPLVVLNVGSMYFFGPLSFAGVFANAQLQLGYDEYVLNRLSDAVSLASPETGQWIENHHAAIIGAGNGVIGLGVAAYKLSGLTRVQNAAGVVKAATTYGLKGLGTATYGLKGLGTAAYGAGVALLKGAGAGILAHPFIFAGSVLSIAAVGGVYYVYNDNDLSTKAKSIYHNLSAGVQNGYNNVSTTVAEFINPALYAKVSELYAKVPAEDKYANTTALADDAFNAIALERTWADFAKASPPAAAPVAPSAPASANPTPQGGNGGGVLHQDGNGGGDLSNVDKVDGYRGDDEGADATTLSSEEAEKQALRDEVNKLVEYSGRPAQIARAAYRKLTYTRNLGPLEKQILELIIGCNQFSRNGRSNEGVRLQLDSIVAKLISFKEDLAQKESQKEGDAAVPMGTPHGKADADGVHAHSSSSNTLLGSPDVCGGRTPPLASPNLDMLRCHSAATSPDVPGGRTPPLASPDLDMLRYDSAATSPDVRGGSTPPLASPNLDMLRCNSAATSPDVRGGRTPPPSSPKGTHKQVAEADLIPEVRRLFDDEENLDNTRPAVSKGASGRNDASAQKKTKASEPFPTAEVAFTVANIGSALLRHREDISGTVDRLPKGMSDPLKGAAVTVERGYYDLGDYTGVSDSSLPGVKFIYDRPIQTLQVVLGFTQFLASGVGYYGYQGLVDSGAVRAVAGTAVNAIVDYTYPSPTLENNEASVLLEQLLSLFADAVIHGAIPLAFMPLKGSGFVAGALGASLGTQHFIPAEDRGFVAEGIIKAANAFQTLSLVSHSYSQIKTAYSSTVLTKPKKAMMIASAITGAGLHILHLAHKWSDTASEAYKAYQDADGTLGHALAVFTGFANTQIYDAYNKAEEGKGIESVSKVAKCGALDWTAYFKITNNCEGQAAIRDFYNHKVTEAFDLLFSHIALNLHCGNQDIPYIFTNVAIQTRERIREEVRSKYDTHLERVSLNFDDLVQGHKTAGKTSEQAYYSAFSSGGKRFGLTDNGFKEIRTAWETIKKILGEEEYKKQGFYPEAITLEQAIQFNNVMNSNYNGLDDKYVLKVALAFSKISGLHKDGNTVCTNVKSPGFSSKFFSSVENATEQTKFCKEINLQPCTLENFVLRMTDSQQSEEGKAHVDLVIDEIVKEIIGDSAPIGFGL